MGMPSFMAPEQASGRAHQAGPAADIYALGAILYVCLSGRLPFKGKTVVETLDQVRTQEPVPPSRWRASVPLDLETICLKCLRKEPESSWHDTTTDPSPIRGTSSASPRRKTSASIAGAGRRVPEPAWTEKAGRSDPDAAQ